MTVKVGDRWTSGDKVFFVIAKVDDGKNIWIHYRNDTTGQEYSCWEESFVHRFIKDETYERRPR